MYKAYPAVFHYESDGFWVEFPDLPGCQSEGDSIANAMAEASSALGAYLCSLADRDLSIPEPSDIHTHIVAAPDFVSMVIGDPDAFRKRTRAVKKTLTIPEWLNDEAEKRHVNFSSVLQQALIAQLQ